MCRYCNFLLCKGIKDLQGDALDAALRDVISVFKLIDDKVPALCFVSGRRAKCFRLPLGCVCEILFEIACEAIDTVGVRLGRCGKTSFGTQSVVVSPSRTSRTECFGRIG